MENGRPKARNGGELTYTMREYLVAAWKLSSEEAPITVTALARQQQVAPASATAMVKKLTALGLLKHHHYGSIELTEEGRLQALLAVRRHRLVECFLVQMLAYRLDEVHGEAHAIEPVISDRFEHKIDVALGHPKRCPHGDPIPDINGVIDVERGIPLTEVEKGRPVHILSIPSSRNDLLRYLVELGVEPGKSVSLIKSEPFGGPLHLKIGRKTVLLGPEAAQKIYVSASRS